MFSSDPENDRANLTRPFSEKWTTIASALMLAEDGRSCERIEGARNAIAEDYEAIAAYAATTQRPIYGVNTLPGHRMGDILDDAAIRGFSDALLTSHRLGSEPFLDAGTARCVVAAKLFSFAAGGSLCSGDLYDHLRGAAKEPSFAPDMPRHASYSSGDVICGAHFARALLDFPRSGACTLKPGEAMSLVNGAYVHVGRTLALVRPLDRAFRDFMAASAMTLALCEGRPILERAHQAAAGGDMAEWFGALLARVPDAARPLSSQPSVSVRATPETAIAFHGAARAVLDALDRALGAPSNNPLWVRTGDDVRPVSQGSFVDPGLALATDGLVSAVLMSAWLCCGRVNYLLSGAAGTPADGARRPGDISLIQLPKYLWQKLERLRRRHGARAFASGASMSRGIEDFWTMGTEIANDLEEALAAFGEIAAIEWQTGVILTNRFGGGETLPDQLRGLADPLPDGALRERMREANPFPALALLRP